MSDFLIVRGLEGSALQALLDTWVGEHTWVRTARTRNAWEKQELEINGRNALGYANGKHKTELAELVQCLERHGAHVVHVMLRPGPCGRQEQDMGEWADRLTRAHR